MTFLSSEKKLQTAWKLQNHALPRMAKTPGLYRSKLYPFYLSLEFAAFNLFSEIRDEALDTFDPLGVFWHSSALQGLCSNHLCSSQVFAVTSSSLLFTAPTHSLTYYARTSLTLSV